MAKLSIIIPYCTEYPQVYFTVCNLRCELEQSDIDWEVITVANKSSDKSYERLKATQTSRIKALEYNEKLSHWCAKNEAIKNSTGDVLFFIDSHCIVSKDAILNMFNYYTTHYEELHGTLHLPILYMNEAKERELEYKLQANITDKKLVGDTNSKNTPQNLHYSFTRYKNYVTCPKCKQVFTASGTPVVCINPKCKFKFMPEPRHHRVSCMSTCGMMISRELMVDKLKMWPSALGIYGGGENFINFTLAMMGYHINVFCRPNNLHHYAEKRGYSWNYDDHVRNRIIAAYMYGGEEWAHIFALNVRGRPKVLEEIYQDVIATCKEHREAIKKYIITTPQEWVEQEAKEGRFQGIYK